MLRNIYCTEYCSVINKNVNKRVENIKISLTYWKIFEKAKVILRLQIIKEVAGHSKKTFCGVSLSYWLSETGHVTFNEILCASKGRSDSGTNWGEKKGKNWISGVDKRTCYPTYRSSTAVNPDNKPNIR